MAFTIDIQHASADMVPVSDELLQHWVAITLDGQVQAAELSLATVSKEEMTHLNQQYRHKLGPTNVLSFPSQLPQSILAQLPEPHLGDIIICPEVLSEEALTQNKILSHHWAHIVIHGTLHLLGYDHQTADEETQMQALEIHLLDTQKIANPYD